MWKLLLLPIILAAGCAFGPEEKAAIKIEEIGFSPYEFEEAFKMSRFYHLGEEGKEEFLDTFISRKLILREAERIGLDKDPEFLKNIQIFWEQSLLKLFISQQMKELSLDIDVSDREIRNYFERNQESFQDKDIAQVYSQIKWILFQGKQQEAVDRWVDSLKKDVEIIIDYDLLGLDKSK